jgi:hypothetical protein
MGQGDCTNVRIGSIPSAVEVVCHEVEEVDNRVDGNDVKAAEVPV